MDKLHLLECLETFRRTEHRASCTAVGVSRDKSDHFLVMTGCSGQACSRA